jgi:hypothetical protein
LQTRQSGSLVEAVRKSADALLPKAALNHCVSFNFAFVGKNAFDDAVGKVFEIGI